LRRRSIDGRDADRRYRRATGANAGRLRFDRPLIIQYGLWLWKVLHGDLGTSIASGRPVLSEVSRAVTNSLILASVATLIGFTFGTLFGFVAGYFRNSRSTRPLPRFRYSVSGAALLARHGAGHRVFGAVELAAVDRRRTGGSGIGGLTPSI